MEKANIKKWDESQVTIETAPAPAADNRDALVNDTFDAIKRKVIKNSEAVPYMLERSIDAGCPLWSEKWFGFAELPRKYFDGHRYSVCNTILLGFQGGFYISESEARRLLGDNVKPKPGAIARRVLMPVFLGAKTPNKKELQALREGEETTNTPNSYPDFYRVERVYDQTAFEGLPLKKTRELPNTPNERNARAEKVLKDFCAANNIIFTATTGGASACCEHVEDPKAPININVPDISQFKSATAYYSVVFHECTHAANRRNGCQLTKKREELAAEIGACIVLNSLGFDPDEYIDDAAAYVREFKDAAKEKNAIKKAWKYALSSALLILKTFIDDQTADAETTTAAESTPAVNETPAPVVETAADDDGEKKAKEIDGLLIQYWNGLRKLDECWNVLQNAKLRQLEGNISERISAARSDFPAYSAKWGELNQRLANIRMVHAARERYWERAREINQERLF